jgi:hypothetical protein
MAPLTLDPNRPEVLLSVPTEIEATAIVTALTEYGVEAIATGGYTSGFRAEAPGSVAVVVKHMDLDRAMQALAEIQETQTQIDWSKVDVSEEADDQPQADQSSDAASNWAAIGDHLGWIVVFLGIAIGLVVWLFMR